MQIVSVPRRLSEVQWPFLKISGRVGVGVRGGHGGSLWGVKRRMIYATPVLCFDFNKQGLSADCEAPVLGFS